VEVKTKICSRCHKKLPATTDVFNRNKGGVYGLHHTCRECRIEYNRDIRAKKAAGEFAVFTEIPGEKWESIIEYDGWYEISDFGRVKRIKKGPGSTVGRILKTFLSKPGYCRVCLCKDTKRRYKNVHRLVMAAFVGPCPEGKQVNHIDGDKENNHIENLEYVTQSENIRHSFAIGTRSQRGEKNTQSSLTEDNVHEIRHLSLCGLTQKSIASRFNVTRTAISSIMTGKTWAYLKEEGKWEDE